MLDGKFAKLAVVTRSFTNPHVESQAKNFLNMGVALVIVVVKGLADKGATKGYLSGIKDARLRIFEMQEGYTWSNALNLALMAIQIGNAERTQTGKGEVGFILNASVEAKFSREHVERMLDAITDSDHIGVVGTSFRGLQSGNEVHLGRSYKHPRNTGMLLSLKAIGAMAGGFNAWCDDIGGMEDIEYVLRMKALTDLEVRMLDLKAPLIVGANYHQPTKEINEQKAMDQIIAMWRSIYPEGTPERQKIDATIDKMGIEA